MNLREQIHFFSSNFYTKKFSVLKYKKEKLEQINIKNYVDLKEF